MECSECKTENGYYKITTNEWICRKCGTKTTINKEENNEAQGN